ncbi:MAG: hypothetical protein AB7P00_04800 [Sandaracinaceae bacterium]
MVVWKRDGANWIVEQTLAGSGALYSDFGRDVTLEGDTLAVCEPYTNSVHVFLRSVTGWVESQVLDAPLPLRGLLSLTGDTLVAGPRVFVRPPGGTFALAQTLAASPIQSLDFDGLRIAIGQPFLGQGGRVLIYAKQSNGSFALEQTIAPALQVNARFGARVAIDQGTLAVIADNVTEPNPFLSVYQRSRAFSLSAVFDAPDDTFWTLEWVDVLGDRIALGDTSGWTGGAHMFRRVGGVWVASPPVLIGSDVHMNGMSEGFGRSLALDANGLVVGAPGWHPGNAIEQYGAAYYFSFPITDPLEPAGLALLEADILFGVTEGGGGVIVLPGSGPVPVDPEPFLRWTELTVAQRAYVIERLTFAIELLTRDPSSQEGLAILHDPLAGAPSR